VVVLDGGDARQHHAAQAQVAYALQVFDALLGRAHRRLPGAEKPVRMGRAVLRHPAVVGVEAGLLVVEVLVVAELHADRRVDDLGGDAVAFLVGEAGLRVPAAAVQVLELHAHHADLLRGLAGGGHQAHGDGRLHAVDDEEVADVLAAVDHLGRLVAPRRVDVVDVGARRLGDVRVGRDDGIAQPCAPLTSFPGRAPVCTPSAYTSVPDTIVCR